MFKKIVFVTLFSICMLQAGNVAVAYDGEGANKNTEDVEILSNELRLAIVENRPVSSMSKQEQLELAELLPADGSAISFQSDAYGQLRSTKGICTASTQNIHQRISMQKDYIGNKPETHCDNVAKYIQMDTVIFRKEWYGWGNPTAYSSYRLNVKDFTNKGIARKCVDQTKHDWRAINSHYIVDKFGCKHTLYSSTTAEGLECS